MAKLLYESDEHDRSLSPNSSDMADTLSTAFRLCPKTYLPKASPTSKDSFKATLNTHL